MSSTCSMLNVPPPNGWQRSSAVEPRGCRLCVEQNVNLLVLLPGKKPSLRGRRQRPGEAVVFTFSGNPELLLRSVPFGRFRYQVGP